MYEQHAQAYRKVAEGAKSDLAKAALVVGVREDGKGCRVTRVGTPENGPVIPEGALVWFKRADIAELPFGSYVLVRRNGEMIVRRLVRTEVSPAGLVLHLATAKGDKEPPVGSASFVGVVTEVHVGERSFNPAREPGWAAVRNFLTDYNTCSPAAKLMRMATAVLPARMRPSH